MGKIWRIKDTLEGLITIEYNLDKNYIKLNLKDIKLESEFSNKILDENIKIAILKKDRQFSDLLRNLSLMEDGSYLCIKKDDKNYLILKTINKPIVDKNGFKIEIIDFKEINDEFEIPISLRYDNKTKLTKLIEYKNIELQNFKIILEGILNNKKNIFEIYKDYFLDSKKEATSSSNGYYLQSLMGVFFIFYKKNYKFIKSIKIEGKLEDIHLEYRDGTFDCIQVKVSETPNEEKKFSSSRFKEGINSLEETCKKINLCNLKANKLIYASNTIYQPLESLTNPLKLQTISYFCKNINTDILVDDREVFFQNYILSPELKERFYIAAVGNDILKAENGLYLDEYNNLNEIFGTSADKMRIYEELQNKCIKNSTKKQVGIDIYEIANSFLKKARIDKFDELYCEELYGMYFEKIEDLLIENDIYEIFFEVIKEQYIITIFLLYKRNYEKSYGELKLKSLKHFIDNSYQKLIDEAIFFSKIQDKDIEAIVHKYILYKVFMNENSRKKIIREFSLEEI